MFTLLILEYTLSSIVVFLFILKFEVYKIYALQCCIFAPSFGMHKKTSQPDVGAVSTDTATHIELSNVVATLISYCRVCVPYKSEAKMNILREAHRTPYLVQPGEATMYQDIRQSFWWKHMKVDIAKYVASCGICQKVKAEHKRPTRLLKALEIPEWKWRILLWTLWLVCHVLLVVRMQFGWS
jgi:hypothetical protein